MGEVECRYMFKNIERKQKLIDDKNRTREHKATNSVKLFSSGFVRELNHVSNSSLSVNSETARHTQDSCLGQPNKLQAIQYIKNKRQPYKASNLESIINMMSRFIDESKVLHSRIDTQFSDLTLQCPVDDLATMQSFLHEYDA